MISTHTRDNLRTRQHRAQEFLAFRVRHTLTQQKLAELLGISRQTVVNVERARGSMRIPLLERFHTLKVKREFERQREELEFAQRARLIAGKQERRETPSQWS